MITLFSVALTEDDRVLSSLNLPGSLQALEKPLGIPSGLVNHAEEIRQQGGIDHLFKTMRDTEQLKENDRAIFQEGVEALRAEAFEDEQGRRRFGTQSWTRPASEEAAPKLYAQVREIEQYLASAESSDQLVRTKLKENERLIALLGDSNRDLEEVVPSSRVVSLPAKLEKEASRLRTCVDEISRLESRRRRKIEAVKTKAKQDDISECLLHRAGQRLTAQTPSSWRKRLAWSANIPCRASKPSNLKTSSTPGCGNMTSTKRW